MARQIFKGGTRKGKLHIPPNPANPLPKQIKSQFRQHIRTVGIDTNLYRARQTQSARRNQTWVWDREGAV